MNIHPLFVHFPIALLALYSLLELCTFIVLPLRRQSWLFAVKAFLLFTGVLGALAAYATGGIAEDLVREANTRIYIVEIHEPFAIATTILYLILAAAYIVRAFDQKGWGNHIAGMANPFMRIWNVKKYLTHLILDTWLLPFLIMCALFDLAVVGALGAAITYGPSANPPVSLIYSFFWF